MGKIAIITGISGQDGSYLAELLLEKKYKMVLPINVVPQTIKRMEASTIKNGILLRKDVRLSASDGGGAPVSASSGSLHI